MLRFLTILVSGLLLPSLLLAAVFTEPLYKGLRNSQVEEFQKFLKQSPEIYPEGLVTGYFGNLTEMAVKRFQAKYGIVSQGSPETTGYGRVGPLTRAKLNELLAVSAVVPASVAASEPVTVPTAPSAPEPLPACRTRKVPADFQTIQSAIAAACEGDTILISDGSYSENLNITVNKITLKSESGAEKTVINPARGQVITSVDGIKEFVVDGFTIQSDGSNAGILLVAEPGAMVAYTIQNSIIKNNSIGISVTADSGSLTIKNNFIISNKLFGIYDNISQNGTLTAQNNTIVKSDTGYYLYAANGNHKLINNIIALNITDGVAVASRSTTEEYSILNISYNDVWNNKVNNYYSYRRSVSFTPSGGGNLSTDPYFVSDSDYHLRSNSSMIDAGDPSLLADSDGSRANIGAY